MKIVLDLHLHSRYSRACSPQLTLEGIDSACRVKGVGVVATGDFTYPAWFSALKNELTEIACPTRLTASHGGRGQSGLYKLKNSADDKIKFLLSTELSLIYKAGGKARRIHLVVHAPNLSAVAELNEFLDKHYNIRSDGRPILGMSAPDLVKLCLKIHPEFLIYPAHIWTPWFSVFGSKSGFDSLEECFGDETGNIYAYETGLSSDPEMNWRVSALDKLTLLSNSDAHSPANIAREANVFELGEFSYAEIYNIIKSKQSEKILYTIEFYPEEGMYHFDGHRDCGFSCEPAEALKLKGICPKCGRPLTIGVANRVEELADNPAGRRPEGASDFKKLVELDKIIAECLNIKSRQSKQVQAEYHKLIKALGSELYILIDAPLDKIKTASNGRVAEAIKRVRAGELIIRPGYDGRYGEVRIFADNEKEVQKSLF
jgi:DNA helicase-2/ATP-dependent DNA helicase PcrA